MDFRHLTLTALMLFSITFSKGQLLSTDETIEYLNSLENENPNGTKYVGGILSCMEESYKTYSLLEDGSLRIKSYIRHFDCDNPKREKTSLKQEETIHITEIDLNKLREEDTHSTNYVIIPCKEGNCVIAVNHFAINPTFGYDRSRIKILEKNNYIKQKTLNALIYLISIAQADEKYARKDQEDPFAPQNFTDSRYKIISKEQLAEIKLSEENGVFTLWVYFGNNFKREFILDSGASEMSISSLLEKELIENGLLRKEDYLPSGLYQLADGSVISARRFKVTKLTVGQFTVHNVTASVGNHHSPLLLGRSFLDKFKQWTIDNNTGTLVLHK